MSSDKATASSVLARNVSPDATVVVLQHGGFIERHVTVVHRGNARDTFAKALQAAREGGARIIAQDVIGIDEASAPADLSVAAGEVTWPVTWLRSFEAAPNVGGTQLVAIAGADIVPVRLRGRVVGCTYQDAHARYCRLGDLRDSDISLPQSQQAATVFDDMLTALKSVGMDFSNVLRTWLYADRILAWYDKLNLVRNDFFNKHGVFDGLVPASTGIGAANAQGAAMVANLLAVVPKDPAVRAFEVPSPLQCPAPKYGSSFSRAVELACPQSRRLWVSGTASIEPGGKTVHLDDIARQIDLTMEVVGAILAHQNMTWADTTRAIAYYTRKEFLPHFDAWCRDHGLGPMPVVNLLSDVCRGDLLFEIELDAMKAN